jgi:hypothetical protein
VDTEKVSDFYSVWKSFFAGQILNDNNSTHNSNTKACVDDAAAADNSYCINIINRVFDFALKLMSAKLDDLPLQPVAEQANAYILSQINVNVASSHTSGFQHHHQHNANANANATTKIAFKTSQKVNTTFSTKSTTSPSLQPSSSSSLHINQPSSIQNQSEMSFKDTLAAIADMHSCVFMPNTKKGSVDGKTVYLFGKCNIIVDKDVIYINQSDKEKNAISGSTAHQTTIASGWIPISIQELLHINDINV